MNIHPLFVHFPIGLLATYSVLELAAAFLPRLRRAASFAPIATFLLSFGVLAAFAAIITGGMAEDIVRDSVTGPIIELHEPFAVTTTIIYLVLAAAYLIRLSEGKVWAEGLAAENGLFTAVWRAKRALARLILDTPLRALLALLGLVAITITGALGASIVYGPNVDPFVSVIYHLFLP